MSEKVIYTIDGKQLYGIRLSQERIAALGLEQCTNEPCSGLYFCEETTGIMYRCVLDPATGHGCDWVETAEVC